MFSSGRGNATIWGGIGRRVSRRRFGSVYASLAWLIGFGAPAGHPTICRFPQYAQSGHGGVKMGQSSIDTPVLRARLADSAWIRISAVAIPLMLLAPALWNGYPLLQWDTGGYLARWYEGYLVPSRSTVFGLYLHFGEDSSFWINLGIEA